MICKLEIRVSTNGNNTPRIGVVVLMMGDRLHTDDTE